MGIILMNICPCYKLRNTKKEMGKALLVSIKPYHAITKQLYFNTIQWHTTVSPCLSSLRQTRVERKSFLQLAIRAS